MTEDEARRVELLRAVEVEDPEASPLTREDRMQAEAHARTASAPLQGRHAADAYVASRAEFAMARLGTRHLPCSGFRHPTAREGDTDGTGIHRTYVSEIERGGGTPLCQSLRARRPSRSTYLQAAHTGGLSPSPSCGF